MKMEVQEGRSDDGVRFFRKKHVGACNGKGVKTIIFKNTKAEEKQEQHHHKSRYLKWIQENKDANANNKKVS